MKLSFEEREKLEADLVFAMEPVWRMSKEEQKPFLEAFINRCMTRANIIHEPISFLERVVENVEVPEITE